MKGYSGTRGQSFKLEFDAASGQFNSRQIPHEFSLVTATNFIVKKLKQKLKADKQRKAEVQLKLLLASLGPTIRDDVGMAEVYEATLNL
jgi:hypothetical protein